MLHVILLILKIIGIILLALIGLLLLIILTVLLVPIRYKVAAEHGKEVLQVDARANWLFHLLRARVTHLEGVLHIRIKVLWLTLYDNLNPKKPKEKGDEGDRTKYRKYKAGRKNDRKTDIVSKEIITKKSSEVVINSKKTTLKETANNTIDSKEIASNEIDSHVMTSKDIAKERIIKDRTKESKSNESKSNESKSNESKSNERIAVDIDSEEKKANILTANKDLNIKLEIDKTELNMNTINNETNQEFKQENNQDLNNQIIEDNKQDLQSIRNTSNDASKDIGKVLNKSSNKDIKSEFVHQIKYTQSHDTISIDNEKNTSKSLGQQVKYLDVQETEERVTFFQNIINKINNVKEKILSFIKGLRNKITALKNKITALKNKIFELREKIKSWIQSATDIKHKISLVSDFIKDEMNRQGFKITYASLKRILKHILPRKMKSRIVFGTGDPCSTGQALGAMSILYSFYGDKVQIIPDFENEVFEGKHYAKGRIRLVTLLIIVIKLILDKRFKQLKKNFQILKEAL